MKIPKATTRAGILVSAAGACDAREHTAKFYCGFIVRRFDIDGEHRAFPTINEFELVHHPAALTLAAM